MDNTRRYIRQTMLPEVGEAGQTRLAAARVLVVGAGGLGSPLITYLAACGVGHLGIIDHDRVELSNLPRQILYEESDIGRRKVEAATDRAQELNPTCRITPYPFALTAENISALLADGYDVVADGCDNFATRFVVNAACVTHRIPLVSAAVAGWNGQLASFDTTHGTGCYACLVHPHAPEANSCRESGIIAPLAGMVGTAQALEVLRMLLGFPALLGQMTAFNGRTATQRTLRIPADPACPVCAPTRTPKHASLHPHRQEGREGAIETP